MVIIGVTDELSRATMFSNTLNRNNNVKEDKHNNVDRNCLTLFIASEPVTYTCSYLSLTSKYLALGKKKHTRFQLCTIIKSVSDLEIK